MSTIPEAEGCLWGSILPQLFTYFVLYFLSFLFVYFIFLLRWGSHHVAQVGHELSVTCLCLLGARMTGTGRHTWFRFNFS